MYKQSQSDQGNASCGPGKRLCLYGWHWSSTSKKGGSILSFLNLTGFQKMDQKRLDWMIEKTLQELLLPFVFRIVLNSDYIQKII